MPIRVFDHDNNQEIDVSAAEAQDGIAKGYFEPRGKVRVARGNQTGSVDAKDIGGSLANGWRLVEDDEAEQIRLTREESTAASQAVATVESAASGATLGLSDIIETEVLGVDPTRMAARAEAAGPLADAAFVAGAVAPALLTGGGSSAATGAGLAGRAAGGLAGRGLGLAGRALTAPVRALEGAGGLVERGLVRALGEGGIARAVGAGGRGAVEGVGYEIGAQIHENTLGNREWSAELLSAGINGGVLGGGIGMAIPGLSRIAGGKTKLPERATAEILAKHFDGQPRNFGGLAKAISGGSAKRAESIESVLTDLAGPKDRANLQYRAVYERDDLIRETAEGVVRETNDLNRVLRESRIETEGAFKKSNVSRLLPAGADDVVPRMVQDRVSKMHPQIRGAQDLAERYKGELLRADIDEVADRLRKLEGDLEGASAAEAFVATQETARDIGEKMGKLRKTAFASRASERTLDEVGKIYRMFRGADDAPGILGDAAIWGDDVAGMYGEITKADAVSMQLKRDLIGKDGKGRNALGRLLDGSPTSLEDAIAFAKQTGKPRGDAQGEVLDAAFQAEIGALRARAKHYDDPAFKQRLATVEDAYAAYKSKMSTMSEAADMLDAYRDLGAGGGVSGLLTAFGPSGAAVTGGLIGGLPGAALGAAVNVVARPQQALRAAIGIRHLLDKIDGGIGESVGRFLSGMRGGSKAARPARASTKAARVEGRGGARKAAIAGAAVVSAKSRDERQRRSQHFQDRAMLLATSPDALVKELGPLMYDVDAAAPGLAGHLQANIQRAAIFLASKQPASYTEPYSPDPPIVDQVALDKYERYVETVTDPLAVLDRMSDGTVTIEHAEALREVYPQIYQRIQGQVLETLGESVEKGDRIPFSKRIQVGILFDLPTDNSLLYAPQNPAVPGAVQEEREQSSQRSSVRAHKLDGTDDMNTEIGRIESGVA
jgi:hypothetical protein